MSEKKEQCCKYCGNRISTPSFSSKVSIRKYCSDRCWFLIRGVNVNTNLGVFININQVLVTEFTDMVTEYESIPYRNMHTYIHSGVSPLKRHKGLSGNEIAKKILFACHDISSQLIFKGGRLDYRMFLVAGPNSESKVNLTESKASSEVKKAISLTNQSTKQFIKELERMSGIYKRNKTEEITQNKYTSMAFKFCRRLEALYDLNKDNLHLLYGETKAGVVLKACFNRKVSIDSSSAFYLARYLDTMDVKIDYRLLIEPISPSQLATIKLKLN